MEAEDDVGGRSGSARHGIGRTAVPELAVGGLSLDDFRQDALLAEIETRARYPVASDESCDPRTSELAARKRFRQHEDRERRWASIRSYQTVALDNGWRGADRDRRWSARGGAISRYDTELFGQIRPENSRHPKPKAGARADTPLRRLLVQIIDNGLEQGFLQTLTQHIADRAISDPGLVRQYVLLVTGSGFDTRSMRPIKEVDDDLVLKSGDNKRIAERLTALGFATTTRDVENTKKRLDRLVLEIGTQVLSGAPLGKGSKE